MWSFSFQKENKLFKIPKKLIILLKEKSINWNNLSTTKNRWKKL
jgi:hypothetical protein